ncbi:MAG: helix-turn-helix transcriptional regulator [Bacteroidota bacterium]
MKFEEIYNKLREQYTDEEIADSMLIPQDLTPEELKEANEELKAFRFSLLHQKSEKKRIYSDLLRFKYTMEDYLKSDSFDQEKSFGKHLAEYIRILNRTKKSLSEDIGVHYTRLSRIFNDREEPNIELMYRLERHSGDIIPAIYWWKLLVKKQEFTIRQDAEKRKTEGDKVKNAIKFRA